MRRANSPRPTLVAFCSVVLIAVVGCGTSPPPPSVAPTAAAVRPAVQIDQTWTSTNGIWTFKGSVDPEGDATDVVLEIGPGPATARRFDAKVAVAQDLVAAGPVTITTREIPDIKDICVRFTATNGVGTTSSSPLCFPHDLPTIAPPGAPTVRIDPNWTVANGQWTFSGPVDPKGLPTDVVLEVGAGPASSGTFETPIAVAQDVTDAATLTITTREIPDVKDVCVRFTATNSMGTASSMPLCFPHDAPAGSSGSSPAP
jgi:hypothetical protein